MYRLDSLKGKLVPGDAPFVKSRYGAGPRHIAFHPQLPYAYLVNELDSTVTTYRWDSGRGELTPVQVVTTLPTSSPATTRERRSPSRRRAHSCSRRIAVTTAS